MMEIETPKIEVEESEDRSYAKIVVEPLEKEFGLTLGNALRGRFYRRFPALLRKALNSLAVLNTSFLQFPELRKTLQK